MAALAWAPQRKFAVYDACVRALMTMGGAASLDAFATYRGQDAGNMEDLGAAWDRFDRREFARRVFASPVVISGGKGKGLRRIDGIECVENLQSLTLAIADGCSLEPLTRCTQLLHLALFAFGDVDLSPVASLPDFDLLDILGMKKIRSFEAMSGARMRKLSVSMGEGVSWGFLEALPRLQRVELSSPRTTLEPCDRDVLRRLVARGVGICGHTHEPWTSRLAELGGVVSEKGGRRAVGREDLTLYLSGSFCSGCGDRTPRHLAARCESAVAPAGVSRVSVE